MMETGFTDNSSMTPNATTNVLVTVNQSDGAIAKLRIVMDAMLISLTVILMLSFGCSIKAKDIKYHVTKPISVSIAMVCQFILVPYVFYGFSKAVILNQYDAPSLVILSTSPAGGVANLYVHWAEGDIALGIIVTALSTLLGLVFMPLNFWMFGHEDHEQILPYIETVISLVITLIPVALGMAVLKWYPRGAKWMSRAGSAVGGLLVFATIGLSSYMYPKMYTSGWKTWLTASIFSPVSFLIGYLLTLAMRMPGQVRRTIGITTSVKSIALCLTIVAVSFPVDSYHLSLVFPELHSIIMLIELALICFIFRIIRCCHGKYFMEVGGDLTEDPTVVSTDTEGGVANPHPACESDAIYTVSDRNRHVARRMSDTCALQPEISLALFNNHL